MNDFGTTIVLDKGDYYEYFVFHSQRIDRIMLDMIVKYNKFDGSCEVINDYDVLKQEYIANQDAMFDTIRKAVFDKYTPVIN